jgi:hypothetical protein
MTRIAVSPRAYRAIKASLPEGSVIYPPDADGAASPRPCGHSVLFAELL